MQIYFVRHGKTEWNLTGKYQGCSAQTHLLPDSKADVVKLARYLAPTKFQTIVSSPLIRAQETAEIINEQLKIVPTVQLEQDLQEFNLGLLEGMPYDEAKARYPKAVTGLFAQPELYDAKQIAAESFANVIARGTRIISQLSAQYQAENDKIIIVSHGAFLVTLIQSLLGKPIKDLRAAGGLANTSLSVLETHDAGATFAEVLWNETGFLDRKMDETDII